MKESIKNIAQYILIAMLAALCVLLTLADSFILYARADTDGEMEYSDVLEDLQKDSSFNANAYPQDDEDYSLDIITIAESSDGELFIYVYQPSGSTKDYRASSINISTETGDDLIYYNYKLQYLNSSGVFYKYLVVNFTVLADEEIRYYAITSIYRPFDEDVDEQASGDNTITEVNYNISKQYGITTAGDGSQVIEVVEMETITITDKFVGYVRYPSGFYLYITACDSHFVAFSTDRDIDKLLEADVYYTSQSYVTTNQVFWGISETWGTVKDNYAYLTYDDTGVYEGKGIFTKTYEWDRIQTVDDFIDEVNNEGVTIYSGVFLGISVGSAITDSAMEELQSKQWVLRFAETEYNLTSDAYSTISSRTLVGDVTILRLKFETNGVVYNLGIVDNKQTGSDNPINDWTLQVETKTDWLLIVLMIIISVGGIIIVRVIKKYAK